MVDFITKDKKVIPIKSSKGISSSQVKSKTSEATIDSAKATMLKDKPEMIHGEPVVGFINHHAVTIKIRLESKGSPQKGTDLKMYDSPVELGISAGSWNLSRSDITQGGQMQDTLREEFDKGNMKLKSSISHDEFKKLLNIWDQWHLNDLNAGTDAQRKILDEHENDSKYQKLDKFLDRPRAILKDFKSNPDRGYDYGSAWLYRPIPDDVVDFIKMIQRKLGVS